MARDFLGWRSYTLSSHKKSEKIILGYINRRYLISKWQVSVILYIIYAVYCCRKAFKVCPMS